MYLSTVFPLSEQAHVVFFKEAYGSVADAIGKADGLAVFSFLYAVSYFPFLCYMYMAVYFFYLPPKGYIDTSLSFCL
jgi:hypothetical protein